MTQRGHKLLIALAFIAFVSLGLPDGLLGVGWPSIRGEFGRPLSSLGLLLATGMIGYLTSSFLAGQLIKAIGVGGVLVGSSLLVTCGLVGYALAPAWAVLLLAALAGGLGGGAIDAGINAFAALRFSPRVVNWIHAFWGVGASTGPLLMTAVLAGGRSWRLGYGAVAAVLALLSVLFIATAGLWRIGSSAGPAGHTPTASIGQALRRPMVWMQMGLFFVYCGIESSAGQLYYTLFTETRGIAATTAGLAVGGYWAALTVGRIVFGQLAASLRDRTIVRIGMCICPVAAAVLLWSPLPGIGMAGGVLLGFGLAPIFPTLISMTPQRVGAFYAPQAVGFQVSMAAFGIAVFPSLIGWLSRWWSLEILGVYLVGASVLLLAMDGVATAGGDPRRAS